MCLNERENTFLQCMSMLRCVLSCECACLVSLWKGSHRVNRVEINKDKSSIFSLSDRWFTQKQLRSVIEQPQEMQQTKQCLTPASCSHVWNSIHILLQNDVGEVTYYLQFTVTFRISICYFTFIQYPILSSCMVQGTNKTLHFGFKMITWSFFSPQEGQGSGSITEQ